MSFRTPPVESETFPTVRVDSVDPVPTEVCKALPGDLLDIDIPGHELLELIGQGGFGRVYRARQFRLDRDVAVKILTIDEVVDPAAAAPFETEAMLLARFHHANIVPVFDFGRQDGYMYLTMELLEGEDLAQRIHDEGPLDEQTTWHIIRQAAAGLAHVHSHGIIHRDIKPRNLFLIHAPTGSQLPPGVPIVKVLDFGLASARRTGSEDPCASQFIMAGTPAFMAPEQHETNVIDHRADIFALGATAYQALTGQIPYDSSNVHELYQLKRQKLKPLPAHLSQSYRLLQAMMHPKRALRIASYEELIQRIDQILGISGSHTPSVSQAPFRPALFTRRRLLFSLVPSALLGTAAFFYQRKRADLTLQPPTLKSEGVMEALFDGESLERWSMISGVWSVGQDDERVAILTGSGQIRRTLPPVENFRVTLGLDLREATAELRFAIPRTGTLPCLALRISREEGVQFGMRSKETGPLQQIGATVPFPAIARQRDRRPYIEVRFEYVDNHWHVWFHGLWMGGVRDDGTPKREEWRLLTSDGSIALDTAIIEQVRIADR